MATRSGKHPRTGIEPSTSSWNPIAGFEHGQTTVPQYACVFVRPEPRDCAEQSICDCPVDDLKLPDCEVRARDDESAGLKTFKAVDTRSHGFPATRPLAVLKGLGAQGLLGSICAPDTDGDGPTKGYAPFVAAIVDALPGTGK